MGETRAEMLPALAAALADLPADRPRYLMGVGDPASLVEAVALGVDQFDCVLQTRLGRHGTALTGGGRLQLKQRRARPQRRCPSTRTARCPVCARHSRGYLRHLFQVGEPTAAPPALAAQPGLDARADGRGCRDAIVAGTFGGPPAGDPRRLGVTQVPSRRTLA